ncbi:MAG: hypothetical protein MJZ20_06705 [Bacteroidaceae bacterium]|nr:hypothetical protein [Bacteroidaceae bacterium]
MDAIIDTLYQVIYSGDSALILQPHQPMFSWTISCGDILTLLGLALTYYLFWRQLEENRKDGKKNIRDTWLLEVIIEPNMEQINQFYTDCISGVEDDLKNLSVQYSNTTAKELSSNLAQRKRFYKDSKKDSLDHFQSLIRATEPKLANEIDGTLDSLIDDITKLLDGYEGYTETSKVVKKTLLQNKQKFIATLYGSIKE